jgi:hypothetical protein
MKKLSALFLLLITLAAAACNGGGENGGGEEKERWSIYDWMWNNQNAASNESCFADCHLETAYKLADNFSIIERIRGEEAEDNLSKANYLGSSHFWSQNVPSCADSCHKRDSYENEEMNEAFHFISDPLISGRIGGASCAGCHKIENGHYGRLDAQVNLPNGESAISHNLSAASQECFNCHESANPPESARYFTENRGTAFKGGLHAASAKTDYQDKLGNIDSSTYCGFCHSYNYSWKYNPLNGSKNFSDIKALLGENPYKKMANTSLSCATCHDPHGGGLSKKVREYKDGDKVIYSKEFTLCTSCHAVWLKYEPNPDYPLNRSDYYLDSEVYSSAQAVKEKAGVHFFTDTPEGGRYGLGLNGRFVKTHFATKIGEKIVTGLNGESADEETATIGLNIDAAAQRACTGCHDPHKTSRFAPIPGHITESGLSNIEESYAASPHAAYGNSGWNHTGFGSGGRNCMPCHNAAEAVKFVERVQYAFDFTAGPFKSIQPILINKIGGSAFGCAVCHDPDDTVPQTADGFNINAIKGKLRATEGNHEDGNFYYSVRRGVFNAADSQSLPEKVLAKQKADGSLLCFTCHAGRTNIFIKKDDFTAKSYGTYAHYAPAAANAAGLILPKIKDAAHSRGLEARTDFNDPLTWSAHGGSALLSGNNFPKCAECHDINKNGHSLAAYKKADGSPLITKSRTDIELISSVYAGENCVGCHSSDGGTAVSKAKSTAKGFADLLEFYGNALKIPQVNLRFSQENHGFEFWNGSGWVKDDTPPTAWTSDDKGLKKFAAALTYDALVHDQGAYAHLGTENLRQTLGEVLAFIYRSRGSAGNAADFKNWLQTGGDAFIDSSGTLAGTGAAGVEFLCPAGTCAYDEW